jgi:nucleoside-diphosphate-sugar epimerase
MDVRRFMEFDAVVLLAASLGNTHTDYALNLEIYAALARFMAASVIGTQPFVVYASSAAVYGARVGLHYEDEYPQPETLYGRSKLLGEQVVQDVCSDFTILRFSNVFGDGEGSGVVDIFKRGGRTIYGDGSQVRDYISVNKVVEAINRVVASPRRYTNQLFNISSGEGETVNKVFEKYGHGDAIYEDERGWDVAYSALDNALAKEAGLL